MNSCQYVKCVPIVEISNSKAFTMKQAVQFTVTEQRIIDLAKKIVDLYSVAELKQLAPISPQTIIRWADEDHAPQLSTASCIPSIIAISDQDYNDYLEGNISLDDLWALKGTANRVQVKKEITLQTVLNDAKLLNTMERLKLMSNLWLTLSPVELQALQTPPITIELSDQAKKRLKTLISISNVYRNQTVQSIIEHGANKEFVENIMGDFTSTYIPAIYETLLPYLCVPQQWNGEAPTITDPAKMFTSVNELIESLNAG